jgi:hypothetical protein
MTRLADLPPGGEAAGRRRPLARWLRDGIHSRSSPRARGTMRRRSSAMPGPNPSRAHGGAPAWRELDGWRSAHRRGPDGGVDSDECVRAARPGVARAPGGALALGQRYWQEVERASRGAVRLRVEGEEIGIRLFGVGPALLRFGPAKVVVDAVGVHCTYPIYGGVLARRPAGSITLSQSDSEPPEFCAAIVGFVPRLGRTPLYDQLQRRVHVRISRRYFRRLLREAYQ